MYIPPAFAERDIAKLHAFIETYAFATVVSNGPEGLVATHLPVLLERDRDPFGTLVVHFARANPHWKALDGADVLAIFQGPNGYVSPSWYATHPAVPTWNYAVVHAYGRARMVNDDARLRDIVVRLTEKYEAGRARSWTVDSVPEQFMSSMLKGTVGVEIELTRLEGKLKLSQNRSAADRRNVIAALAQSGNAEDRALADYMARHAPPPSEPS